MNRNLGRRQAVLLACLTLLVGSSIASDANQKPEVQFEQAAEAVERGAFSDALLRLEQLSDRGFVHPDASFNRGLAYLQRAESAQAQPGTISAGLNTTVLP